MILTLRITPEQKERWKGYAAEEGLMLSDWVRRRCDSDGSKDNSGLPQPAPVRVGRRRTRAEAGASGIAVEESKAVLPEIETDERVPKEREKVHRPACKHGVEKGWRCWQCGGPAIIESNRGVAELENAGAGEQLPVEAVDWAPGGLMANSPSLAGSTPAPTNNFEELPIEPTQPIKRRECDHGIMEGYNCWRCRGKAIVRKRV